MVSTLKVAELSAAAQEMKTSLMRVNMQVSVHPDAMTVEIVRAAMKNVGVPPPGVKAVLYFKDEEGDYVSLPDPKSVWPARCISDGLLRAWFMCVPDPPESSTEEPACACLGPHLHMPEKRKLQSIDYDSFKGYCLLAAASDGCSSCVLYWLANDVDPNFRSSNQEYTAMDCVLWAEKKSQVNMASAARVKDLLKTAGGMVNKV